MDTQKLSDEWRTPQWLFDELNTEFNFDIDLCCTEQNTKCKDYIDAGFIESDLPELFSPFRGFMNPPYSNPYPFIHRAWELSVKNFIVCLVKCDPSTRWWAIFWDHENNKPRPGCEVRFLPKRVKFDPPIGYTGKVTTPAFPSAIVVMDRRNKS